MFVETEYFVNKEKRTVVCVMTTYGEIDHRLNKYNMSFTPFFSYNDYCKYVGKAKCSPEDVWDEKFGKKLAEHRAMEKRRKFVNKTLTEVIEEGRKNLRNLEMYGMIQKSHSPLFEKETKHEKNN